MNYGEILERSDRPMVVNRSFMTATTVLYTFNYVFTACSNKPLRTVKGVKVKSCFAGSGSFE